MEAENVKPCIQMKSRAVKSKFCPQLAKRPSGYGRGLSQRDNLGLLKLLWPTWAKFTPDGRFANCGQNLLFTALDFI